LTYGLLEEDVDQCMLLFGCLLLLLL